jgi:hypothetical protein
MNIHLRWWDTLETLCGAEIEKTKHAEGVDIPVPEPTPMVGLHCQECLRIYYAEKIIWALKQDNNLEKKREA